MSVPNPESASRQAREEARRLAAMLIDGAWFDGAQGAIPVIDPATGETVGEVPAGGEAEIDAAVRAARRTFEARDWLRLSAAERTRVLLRVADLIEEEKDLIAALDTLNNGMPWKMARELVRLGAETFRYFAGWCTKIHGLTSDISSPAGQFHAYTLREPVGVAGLIVPWNAPFLFACNKVSVALAAGCSAILKPAEETPLSALKLGELLARAGVPAGVINIVTGTGESAGAALVAHSGVDKISFTGSTEVGRGIVAAAAGNLKKLTLELGGKSPVIVFDDADVPTAVAGIARGIFGNSGQTCMAGSRLYVQRRVHDALMEALVGMAGKLRLGNGFEADTDLGPLVSARQLKRVDGLVRSGIADGAQLLAGGNPCGRPGFFYPPTILTSPPDHSCVVREEVFGPVLVARTFDEPDEALALANDSEYGLAAAVWTRDIRLAHRFARDLRAGLVWLNCQLVTDRMVPFGGYKQSGWGRENGWEGIEAYLQTKSVIVSL